MQRETAPAPRTAHNVTAQAADAPAASQAPWPFAPLTALQQRARAALERRLHIGALAQYPERLQ